MSANFPNNPSVGDLFTSVNNRTFIYVTGLTIGGVAGSSRWVLTATT